MSDDDLEAQEPDELFPADQPNAADPGALKRQRTRSRLKARESDRWWTSVLSTELGRREIWRVLESAGWNRTPFACGPNGFPQPEATWFQAGQQEFAWRLFFSLQRIAPELTLLMQQENDSRFARK